MSLSKLQTASILTIAGSDSGAGAGIQADLKTFSAFGLHGLSVITAVTAQNTKAVESVHCIPAAQVRAQLHAVFADFRIVAVKIGMLGSLTNLDAVIDCLRMQRPPNIVLDPVLRSSSGTTLLPPRALARLRDKLMPLAQIITPNLPEAEALLGRRLRSASEIQHAAHELVQLGARAVLLKGGHARGKTISDYFVTAQSTRVFTHSRQSIAARGTGCTLASAIASGLALGHSCVNAVQIAEDYLQSSLISAFRPGKSQIHVLNHAWQRSKGFTP